MYTSYRYFIVYFFFSIVSSLLRIATPFHSAIQLSPSAAVSRLMLGDLIRSQFVIPATRSPFSHLLCHYQMLQVADLQVKYRHCALSILSSLSIETLVRRAIYGILSIQRQHRISKTSILCLQAALSVHVSAPYWKMNTTSVRQF